MCATVYGWRHLVKTTEVTPALAESNGSLSPGGWRKVTCELTACTLGSAAQRSVTSMVELYLFIVASVSDETDFKIQWLYVHSDTQLVRR